MWFWIQLLNKKNKWKAKYSSSIWFLCDKLCVPFRKEKAFDIYIYMDSRLVLFPFLSFYCVQFLFFFLSITFIIAIAIWRDEQFVSCLLLLLRLKLIDSLRLFFLSLFLFSVLYRENRSSFLCSILFTWRERKQNSYIE